MQKTQERQLQRKHNKPNADMTSLKQMAHVKTQARQLRRKRNSQNANKLNLNKIIDTEVE